MAKWTVAACPSSLSLLIFALTTIIQIAMDPDTISLRISQCIDDLSLLLDQIYKFPQKQREIYYQKITSLKNKLLMLKGTLRETNSSNTEKQYKQIYLAMNSLKNDIAAQSNAVAVAKENREVHGRGRDKEAKRNHEDAMRLVVEKDEEIAALRKELYEKEELIRMNFEELARQKADIDLLLEDNRLLKFQQTSLQIDYETAKAAIGRTSDVTLQYRIREQQKDKAFQSALDELERLKRELIEANEKLHHFQQIAEISIKKTKIVEQNIKKVEREAQDLNQNFRIKENENFKKLRSMAELQFQLNNKNEHVRQLELNNKRLREDIEVLENQIKKASKFNAEQRILANQQKQKLNLQYKRLHVDLENGLARQAELKKVIEESQKKYLLVIGKLNAAQELKARNKQLQYKIQSLQQRLKRAQQFAQEAKRENIHLLKQKQRLNEQIEMQMRGVRQMEIQNFKFRERAKLKDQEKMRLIQQVQIYQCKLKESQKSLVMREVSFQTLQTQIHQQKNKYTKCEERQRIKDKQIENLKIKLLQAKIQTIHEIRQVIN